jgi:peroxiredoxin
MKLERGLPKDWRAKCAALVLLGGVAGATWGIRALPMPHDAALLRVGSVAPEIALPDASGAMVRLSSYRGRGVVLNFMATWCGPCVGEIPLLRDVSSSVPEQAVVFVGIDVGETPQRVASFVREQAIPYPILVDQEGEAAAAYRVSVYPTTYYIDPEGKVLLARSGAFLGNQGFWVLTRSIEGLFGDLLDAVARVNKACSQPPERALDTRLDGPGVDLALGQMTCACGCRSRLTECDCGDPRGGREIRDYFARLLADADFDAGQVGMVTIMKYRNQRVRR